MATHTASYSSELALKWYSSCSTALQAFISLFKDLTSSLTPVAGAISCEGVAAAIKRRANP